MHVKLVDNRNDNTVFSAVVDALQRHDACRLDAASARLSVFALVRLLPHLQAASNCRLLLPALDLDALRLLGDDGDRASRNRLQLRWIADQVRQWLVTNATVLSSRDGVSSAIVTVSGGDAVQAWSGSCHLSTEGLGLRPPSATTLTTFWEETAHATPVKAQLTRVFDELSADRIVTADLLALIDPMVERPAALRVYHHILNAVFDHETQGFDEEEVVKSGTGIHETSVWKMLYRFQRDGVVGAIDKLERYGGCIIADSVGLGKTFEALAIIKYYELRNDRVLVLCPKRLRENWTLHTQNDLRNRLAGDRLAYDVLNHTDLGRDRGLSGDIDLGHVHWGNYDLVVIDESHNFRNNPATRDRVTRYQQLMQRIIRDGVRTRVLMLSATPVNNRIADLRNQIAFATEGRDDGLAPWGIPSILTTTRLAQREFNRWLQLPGERRTPDTLVEHLGYEYFKLLDLLTIARSRPHVVRYYGTDETGRFPDRLKPVNIKADIDVDNTMLAIQDINDSIARLNLAAYTPLNYVLPSRIEAYAEKYRTRIEGGSRVFEQGDRERSMVSLIRVNVLKRLESSVHSFRVTLTRLRSQVDGLLKRLDEHDRSNAELPELEDLDLDDPLFEQLSVGRKVRVLLGDVDRIRWRHDLREDRDRLDELLASTKPVGPDRDAKLQALKGLITQKSLGSVNPGNRKMLVFTAFADTAHYLFDQIAEWALATHGLKAGVITGSSTNRTTVAGLRSDMGSLLCAFSPVSKTGSVAPAEHQIDLLIATDCISEGQNLQDCDTVVNYDIHWNPVRIVQRFGRIDRLGSPNQAIQLVNFWPNVELEEYIQLEQRVSGRMMLLDVSATGEDNLIERNSGDPMNDLEYRRRQLLALQDAVVDLEDLSGGVSITDMTLTDFRVELGRARKKMGDAVGAHWGIHAVVDVSTLPEGSLAAGTLFCLFAATERARLAVPSGYPLGDHLLIHTAADGEVVVEPQRAKAVLDALRLACTEQTEPDAAAWRRFDQATRRGRDMGRIRAQLQAAITAVLGAQQTRAVDSLFTPGGTHALPDEYVGIDDFEVVAFVVLQEPA